MSDPDPAERSEPERDKGNVHRVPDKDAPRIVPERGGVDERDLREHDLATHPDQLEDNPDGAGDRPRPL